MPLGTLHTSVGRRHPRRQGGSTGTVQSRQNGTNGTGKSSHQCTNQITAWSFWSIRGRVAGQHAHGFLLVCRSVETEMDAWYSNGTQKNKDFAKMTSMHKKDNMSFTS